MSGNVICTRAPAKVAAGMKQGEWRKTVMILDQETHDEVADGARDNGCSFAAQARMLIEVGLETLKGEV
jgi:hypothetical protein